MKLLKKIIVCFSILAVGYAQAQAQELNCKVSINHSQVQGTNTQIFKTLENSLTEFINDRKWTAAQYSVIERISCSMNITVKEYTDDGKFKCELIVQANRPVFNSNYNTTLFNFKDANFNFDYLEFNQLEFRDNIIEDNLIAVIVYYVYLIIGLDMDSQAPMGGSSILSSVENIVNSAQNIGEAGWKAFDDSRNRHAIISDYLDPGMQPYRQMMYEYHRQGLDEMAQNADRGRAKITASLGLLKTAKEAKPMSVLPQLFTDIKREELINVYSKGTQKEREEVFDILVYINPAQNNEWEKIKTAR